MIANGFVIGHIPRYPKVHYPTNHLPDKLNLRVEYGHGIQTVNESDIEFSDVFCAAFNSLSGCYKYAFGFTGGYEKELCGNYSITQQMKMPINKHLGQMWPSQILPKFI